MLSVRIFHNYRIETNSAFGNSSRYNQHSNTSAFPATEMRFAFLAQVLLLLLDRPVPRRRAAPVVGRKEPVKPLPVT